MISQYWIEQIPTQPLLIEVRNQAGDLIDLTQYTGYGIAILNPDNESVLTPDFSIDNASFVDGRVIIEFPTQYSIFNQTGEYLVRLEFSNSNGVDFTSTHGLNVSEFGGAE
jgi:hypothetical protein